MNGGLETTSVTAWRCGQCGNVHEHRQDADDCCKCSECGEKFLHENNYGSVCGRCEYGRNVRNARDAVTRAQDDWNRGHARLRELLDNPPPGKRRPKLPAPSPPPAVPVPYVHPDGTVDASAWSPMYEVRDFLLEQAKGFHGQIVSDCRRLADDLTSAIKRAGGGEHAPPGGESVTSHG